jgi:hypothetical protein
MSAKTLVKRFALFFAVYLLCIGCFGLSPVQRGSTALYAKGARSFLSLVLPKAFIRAEPHATQPSTVRVLYHDRQKVMAWIQEGNQRGAKNVQVPLEEFGILLPEFFLYPTLFFICLTLLTPLKRSSKVRGLAVGFAILLLLSWLKLLCYTLYYMSNKPIGIYELQGAARQWVTDVYVHLKIGVGFVVAVLTWLAVTVSRTDWRTLIAENGSGATKSTTQ